MGYRDTLVVFTGACCSQKQGEVKIVLHVLYIYNYLSAVTAQISVSLNELGTSNLA